MLEKLDKDIKTALLAGDKELVSILKFLKSVLLQEKIDQGEISEETATKLMQREAKKRQEAMDLYEKSGDLDRLENEKKEKLIIESYLPAQLSEDEVKVLIDEVMKEFDGNPPHKGAVIQGVIKKANGQTDGGLVARLVNERL